MQTVQLEEAQAHLAELVEGVAGGGEVVIAKGDRAVARLVSVLEAPRKPQFGSARGKITFAPGWDEPFSDFGDYQ